MSGAAQFVGQTISLVSKSDIRYQGVLHSIDPQAATISLEKVRSLGTEGRKSNPAEEVPPSDNVYDFIVFRASDVKDLQIEAAPAADAAPADPAIVGTAAPAAAAASPAQSAASPPKPQAPSAPGAQSPFPPPPPHLAGPGQSPFAPYPPPFPPSPFGAPGPFGPYGNAPFPPHPPFGAPGPFGPPGPFSPPGPGGFPGQPPFPPAPGQQGSPFPPQQPQPPQAGVKSPEAASAQAPAASGQKTSKSNEAVAHGVTAAVASAEHQRSLNANKSASGAPATPNETRPETNGAAAAAAASPKRQPADIEQLAKDMSRANLGQQQPQGRREDGVGASIFSGPAQGQNRSGRALQPYGNAPGGAPPKAGVPVPQEEFDFAKSNATFQKPSALPEPAAAAPAPTNGSSGEQDDFVVPPPAAGAGPTEDFYNPQKSFFDTISSDSKTRNDPAQQSAMGRYGGPSGGGYGGGRYDRAKERERNMEAFGETGAGLGRGQRRGGGGGGGRGPRRQGGGGGGGGYRGGQQQQQQQQYGQRPQ
ncbi:Scd6p [Rhodotorula paludigena]|uniref:Scd6p n=1 Tax=Rhodotorula paludigena TaxID=86838 RepID=UPI00316F75F5